MSQCRPTCTAGCSAISLLSICSVTRRAVARRRSIGHFRPPPAATRSGSITPASPARRFTRPSTISSSPKLKRVGDDVTALRNKGTARTRGDEKQFEILQAFRLELIELRDTLLELASTYKPHHGDGVQISAAPLWPLFRHRPWKKVLKDTWGKLEKETSTGRIWP